MHATELSLHRAWIALGSNITPEIALPRAIFELSKLGKVLRVSSVWESAPVGFVNQPNFCNAAALLSTQLDPHQVRTRLREIEHKLGRVRDPRNKNAPRIIDLDLVIYDDLTLREPGWSVPDPEIPSRPFLAVPLAELDAGYRHPSWDRTLGEIAGTWPSSALQLRREIDLHHQLERARVRFKPSSTRPGG